MAKFPTQLFILGREVFESVSWQAIEDTAKALQECGLFALPYPRVSIRIPLSCFMFAIPTMEEIKRLESHGTRISISEPKPGRFVSHMHGDRLDAIELRDYAYGEPGKVFCIASDGVHTAEERFADTDPDYTSLYADLLVSLLATKNSYKVTEHNKLARLGIGGRKPGSTKRYEYVTTISIPGGALETEPGTSTGRTVCAHLRSGHARRQHYGPGNQYVRSVLIPPVWVNADKEWVRERCAYNVGMPR